MKNVWMFGDSIRMLYQEPVQKLLPEVKIFAPRENCRFSSYLLNSLRFWTPEFEKPDVICFNAGSWDTAILFVDDGPFTPINEYKRNMMSILRELKRYNVPIIYTTSIPVKAEMIKAVATPSIKSPEAPTVFKQNNDRIKSYNDAIVNDFKEQGVIINDMYPLVLEKLDEFISDDGIHPNETGTAFMAEHLAKKIKGLI